MSIQVGVPERVIGEIPYTAHGAQIPPPLIFDFCLFFVFMLILGYVRLGLPRRIRKEV